jgi:hypothetical protein
MRNWRWPLLVLMALHLAAEGSLACVGCREPGAETLAKESSTVLAGWAFSWSVLFMLFFALMIVAGMSLYIWRTCRRLDREAALRISDG